MEFVVVQKTSSKHTAVHYPEAQLDLECLEAESLAAALQKQADRKEETLQRFGATGGGAGHLGGRPRVPIADLRGTMGTEGDESNRLPLGAQRRRHDVAPWEGRAIVKWMIAAQVRNSSEVAWKRECCRRYRPRSWKIY